MTANRDSQALRDEMGDEVRRIGEQREIDEAMDTWLGEELMALTQDSGNPLWNGDRSVLTVREARTDEAAKRFISHQHAIDTGEEDAGTEDLCIYLVPTNEPRCGDRHGG
jgi:hypothetical protein